MIKSLSYVSMKYLCIISLVLLVGCTAKPSINIHEPRNGDAHHEATTSAARVSYAQDESSTRVVIDCPLPGSKHGKPYGTVYLRIPGITGGFDIGDELPGTGIYVQHNGPRAGWTNVQSGRIQWKTRFLGLGSRKAAIDLKTDDTTRIRGTFSAKPDDRRVRQFERRHAQFIRSFSPDP